MLLAGKESATIDQEFASSERSMVKPDSLLELSCQLRSICVYVDDATFKFVGLWGGTSSVVALAVLEKSEFPFVL